MARIGIFGGSFNPPHLGHILAVEEFQRKLSLDRVLLIPASVPPHKQLSDNSASAQQRLEMTSLAVSHLPYAQVLDLELRRQGPCYTADTLRQLRQSYPNDSLFLLMGTDMYLSFENWYRPEEIAEQTSLVLAHRKEEELSLLQEQRHRLEERFGAESIFLDNDFLPYSSTLVRAMLAFDCAEGYLAAPVLEYIRSHGLYYSGADLKNLPFEELSKVSLSLHHAKRVPHVRGCSATATELAQRFGQNVEDAARAGILHDVTKFLGGREQLKLCRKYAMLISDLEEKNPKLLHAKTGAEMARRIFGENEAVCSAICWHTTGRAHMSDLEKIIYLADYIEPNRDFEGVAQLRRLAYEDLDKAMIHGLEMTLQQLKQRNVEINRDSLAALAFLQERT